MVGLKGVSGTAHRNDRKDQKAQCLAILMFTPFVEDRSAVVPSTLHALFSLPGAMLPAPSSAFLDRPTAAASPSLLQDYIPYLVSPIQISRHCKFNPDSLPGCELTGRLPDT